MGGATKLQLLKVITLCIDIGSIGSDLAAMGYTKDIWLYTYAVPTLAKYYMPSAHTGHSLTQVCRSLAARITALHIDLSTKGPGHYGKIMTSVCRSTDLQTILF